MADLDNGLDSGTAGAPSRCVNAGEGGPAFRGFPERRSRTRPSRLRERPHPRDQGPGLHIQIVTVLQQFICLT